MRLLNCGDEDDDEHDDVTDGWHVARCWLYILGGADVPNVYVLRTGDAGDDNGAGGCGNCDGNGNGDGNGSGSEAEVLVMVIVMRMITWDDGEDDLLNMVMEMAMVMVEMWWEREKMWDVRIDIPVDTYRIATRWERLQDECHHL